MPFNTVLVASTAALSAELWQQLACLPERVSSDQLLELVIGFPLRQLGHWALYVWTYLCVSPYPNRPPPRYYDSDDDDDDDDDSDGSSSGGRTQYYQPLRDYDYSSSSARVWISNLQLVSSRWVMGCRRIADFGKNEYLLPNCNQEDDSLFRLFPYLSQML